MRGAVFARNAGTYRGPARCKYVGEEADDGSQRVPLPSEDLAIEHHDTAFECTVRGHLSQTQWAHPPLPTTGLCGRSLSRHLYSIELVHLVDKRPRDVVELLHVFGAGSFRDVSDGCCTC